MQESIISSIRKSELLRNTSVLITGTAAAQLIPIFLQPLLRRYFPPEAFGAYSVYLSLVGILAIISSLKYELAIILPKKNKEAFNILFLCQIINFAFNCVLIIFITVWKKRLIEFLNISSEYSIYLYLVPLGIFFYNLYQSINYWLIREKGFLPISVNKFIRRGFEGAAQLVFKFTGIIHGLILGDLIGHLANIVSGIWQGARRGLSLRLLSITKIRYVTAKYSDYPRFNVIPSLMSACSFLLPAIFINKFYSSAYTGYFDLSKLLLSVPLALISTSLSNVLLQSIAENFQKNHSLKKDLIMVFAIVLAIGITEILVILFFGVGLFELFFGKAWGFSGEISKILVWAYTMNFLVSSFSAIFISMNKIKMLSIWQILYFISILMLIFFRGKEFLVFLKIYVSIEMACYLIMIIMMTMIVVRYERNIQTAKYL